MSASRKSRSHFTVLGYRFRRKRVLAWVTGAFVFASMVAAICLVAYTIVDKRHKALPGHEPDTPPAPAPVAELPTSSQRPSSELEQLVARWSEHNTIDEDAVLVVDATVFEGDDSYQIREYRMPSKFYRRDTLREGEVVLSYQLDGHRILRSTPLGGENIAETQEGLQVLLFASLLMPFEEFERYSNRFRFLFEESYSGEPVVVVGYRQTGKIESRHFFQRESLQELRRLVWMVGAPAGATGQRDIRFEDYKEMAGLSLPGTITLLSGGKEIMRIEIDDVSRVDKLTAGSFDSNIPAL